MLRKLHVIVYFLQALYEFSRDRVQHSEAFPHSRGKADMLYKDQKQFYKQFMVGVMYANYKFIKYVIIYQIFSTGLVLSYLMSLQTTILDLRAY